MICLAPTRAVLAEREWVRNPPSCIKVVNLRPRPRTRCGDLDGLWRRYEMAGLAALGRRELCGNCPWRPGCYWPDQYGAALRGARVIYATHAHLGRAPGFEAQLAAWTGADRVLTLLDEVTFAATTFRRRITRPELGLFAAALDRIPTEDETDSTREWRYLTHLLLRTSTADLRSPDWRFPFFSLEWALEIQAQGWYSFGERFRFLGHTLQQFGHSLLESRERHPNGDLSYAAPPVLRGDFAIFSGTALPEFLRFRLGLGDGLASPFADHRFGHPETHWCNVASRLGMRTHFPANANQILDFFGTLASRRSSEGRRPLLVAKKCFVQPCADVLTGLLREIHPSPVRIVSADWHTTDLESPDVLPIIHFGLIGTNLFELFDCCFCITGYYVNAPIVDAVLQDLLASDGHLPIAITTEGSPRRRHARVADPRQSHLRRGPTGPTRSRPARDGRCAPGRRPRPAVHAAARDHAFPVRRPPAAGLRPRVRLDRGGPRILRTPHAPRTGAGPERRPSPGRTTGGDDAASGGGSAPAGAIDHSTVLEPSRRPHEPF